jgi:dGTPase
MVETNTPLSGYPLPAQERWVAEPPKNTGRSAFERDRARVLHSFALRRLAAKTQVVVPWESDFPRTRLTHSLECAQIGRELGAALGCDADVVETAGLAHDLGHPPFGHTGEAALAEFAESCGGFEGNAQSLRVLTRLEAKVLHPDGRSAGLNLTRATLDGATKYPWPWSPERPKFGVYHDDADVFDWLRAGAPPQRRCLEAQVMDWADDVAYSVHDFEDALHAGHLDPATLRDSDERAELLRVTQETYAPGAGSGAPTDVAELAAALDRLLALPEWPDGYDGSWAAQVALKRSTSTLIGRFCRAAQDETRAKFGPGPLARYEADLVVPREQRLECAVLKAITARYVMRRIGAPERYAAQRDLVTELASAVHVSAPDTLEEPYRTWFIAAPDAASALRVVVDQVASLTDNAARTWHERLCGGRA